MLIVAIFALAGLLSTLIVWAAVYVGGRSL
jgi:hypothetical protein